MSPAGEMGPASAPRGDSPNLQRLGIAAADELRQTVRGALGMLLTGFLKELPGALSEKATKSGNAAEQRACHELARALPGLAPRWIDTFVQKVDGRLVGGISVPVLDGDGATTPESIALAKVELRAEARYQKLITELDARLNRIRLTVYVPIFTKALAPAGLCRSLQDTADAMGWPSFLRYVLFERFDAIVINDLDRLYKMLLEALKRIGTTTAKAAQDPSSNAPSYPKPPPIKPKAATAIDAPADTRKVDPETLSMLHNSAMQPDGEGYTDGLLAADLLTLAEKRPLNGVADDKQWVPMQRVSLAGHFLNEVIADPMVPEELHPQHEAVRFPLVKSALTDSSLFTSAVHPLGSLVNELLLKSATSRISGNVEARRVADLLQEVLVQFDLAPEFVRQAMLKAQPLEDGQIKRFFEMKRQEALRRREAVINEGKRIVVREIELCTFGRNVPEAAMKFLNTAWGPLLIKRLLQYGADNPQWKEALAQMDQLIDQLEVRIPGEPPPPAWLALTRSMAEQLTAGGLSAQRLTEAFATLETARHIPLEPSF